jgi:hypothetical protein
MNNFCKRSVLNSTVIPQSVCPHKAVSVSTKGINAKFSTRIFILSVVVN